MCVCVCVRACVCMCLCVCMSLCVHVRVYIWSCSQSYVRNIILLPQSVAAHTEGIWTMIILGECRTFENLKNIFCVYCRAVNIINYLVLACTASLCNSYTMGTSGLPDIYTRGPQARGLRVYISGEPRVPMV